MAKKELLMEDFLDKISGGTVKDGVYTALDAAMPKLKEVGITKEDLIGSIKETWANDAWKDISTDGSQKDLEDLLAYVEGKF